MKIVLVSGGFDPAHIGHLSLLIEAKRYGMVYVALNSDAWLIRKKGYVFMPYVERELMLKALRMVSGVVSVDDEDDTVAAAIRIVRPDYFINGGDRTEPNPIEHAACLAVGCTEIFNAGGGKIQSSSELVRRARF